MGAILLARVVLNFLAAFSPCSSDSMTFGDFPNEKLALLSEICLIPGCYRVHDGVVCQRGAGAEAGQFGSSHRSDLVKVRNVSTIHMPEIDAKEYHGQARTCA